MAQTNTNSPELVPFTPLNLDASNVTRLSDITIVGSQSNTERQLILPELGTTATTFNQEQIQSIAQGANAPFSQIILRSPGVAQDSAANGDLHIRGEHANLQYRINDVLLPEGIAGFGQELDPRFVDSMQIITGSLPAQYGFRTAGIVDIQTKTGGFGNGGEVEIYGGSHETIRPSFEYSGTAGKWTYFMNGSYEHNALGIENVTASHDAIHDETDQGKAFLFAQYTMDDTSKVSVIGSASYATFEIPIDPGLQPVSTQGDGNPWVAGTFTPTDLNDNQTEQNYYGVISYRKTAGAFDLQTAVFGRNSSAHYVPDNVPAVLFYNGGVATDEKRLLDSAGVQADASYALGDKHTIRGGVMGLFEYITAAATTTVFPVDGAGNINGPQQALTQNNFPNAFFYGMYLQDEWKILPRVTLNYGARFDLYESSFDDENQVSPRANVTWEITDSTTVHGGYARYFTPPPLETVPAGDIAAFNGTSGAAAITTADPVKSERANYYDVGISQKVLPGLTVGLDGYYKTAQNQLDDGLFGQSLILSSFNYAQGEIYGLDFTANYSRGGFSAYANLGSTHAQGKGAASAQFIWPDQVTLNYVNNNWIYLDHDQLLSGSFGVSYAWKVLGRYDTRVYADALYGSGLRQDGGPIPGSVTAANPNGTPIPNGGTVPSYYTINLGAEQRYEIGKAKFLKARVDVVNVTDNSYQLRSGTGVGVNAAQYGARLGVFGSVGLMF